MIRTGETRVAIFLTALLAAGLVWHGGARDAAGGADPVDLPVMYDAPYVLHTEITKSMRKDDLPPVAESQSWEVSVSPTDDGFHTVWRDLTKRQDVVMEIETSESLVPVSVGNLADIRRAMAEAARRDDKDGAGEQVLAFINALPERTLIALMTQDATLVALGQGRSLTSGEPDRYSAQSRPFENGPMLTSLIAVELESVDEATGRAVVLWTSHIDDKALAAVMPEFMRAAMAAIGLDTADQDKVAEAVAGAVMTKTTLCRYQIVVETGLAETVSCVTLQEVRMLDKRQKSETRFEATQTLQP
jgi:hypothetical protein